MVKRYEAGTEARAHVWLQQLQWSGNIGPTVNGNLAGGGLAGGARHSSQVFVLSFSVII